MLLAIEPPISPRPKKPIVRCIKISFSVIFWYDIIFAFSFILCEEIGFVNLNLHLKFVFEICIWQRGANIIVESAYFKNFQEYWNKCLKIIKNFSKIYT